LFFGGNFIWLTGHVNCKDAEQSSYDSGLSHGARIVPQDRRAPACPARG
jgi:hypothetical protein